MSSKFSFLCHFLCSKILITEGILINLGSERTRKEELYALLFEEFVFIWRIERFLIFDQGKILSLASSHLSLKITSFCLSGLSKLSKNRISQSYSLYY